MLYGYIRMDWAESDVLSLVNKEHLCLEQCAPKEPLMLNVLFLRFYASPLLGHILRHISRQLQQKCRKLMTYKVWAYKSYLSH